MFAAALFPKRAPRGRALARIFVLTLPAALAACQPYNPRAGFQPYAQSSMAPIPSLPSGYGAPPPLPARSADSPMQALSALARCQEAYRGQQYVDAITACNAAIDLDPNLAEAFDQRANAYTFLRNYERAIGDYAAVLRLRPSFFYAYNNRGNAYAALGEFDRAIADYTTAVRVRPDYAEAYGNRGSAYAAKTDYQRALADFDLALKLRPDYERVRVNREQAMLRVGDVPIDQAPEMEARNDPPPPPYGAASPYGAAPPFAAPPGPFDGMPVPLPAPPVPLTTAPVPPLATLPEPPGPEPMLPPSDTGRPQMPSQPQPMPFAPGTHIVSGSGIVIDDGRHILTNRHVVEGITPLFARNGTGYLRQARVQALSNEDDLALLEIDRPFDDRCALPLAKLQNPATGRRIIAMGYPLRSILGDDHPSMTEGIVSKSEGFANDQRTFQITNKINPGNSGGPVFDRKGNLMGIIVGKMPSADGNMAGVDIEGLNLAIKADRVLRFLQGRAGAIAVAEADNANADEDIYREMLPCTVLIAGEKPDGKKKDQQVKERERPEQKIAAPRAGPVPGNFLRLPPGYVPRPAPEPDFAL